MSEHAVETSGHEAHDTQPETEAEWHPHPHRWRILSVSLVVGFMSLLDVSIVNVAIPSMQTGLHTSAGTVQWVVSGYALAFGLTLVMGGRLGDAHGRRTMMLIGLTGFTLSSLAVGIAPGIGLVLTARFVQGATAGLLTPQNSGLIQQLFRGPERGKAFGVFGMTVSVSSAVGPVLGGAIIAIAGQSDGWRYLFLVNVPIGVVALVATALIVPRRPRPSAEEQTAAHDRSQRLDVVGAGLLGLTVVLLLYPVVRVESSAYRWLWLLVLVPVAGWAFARWEHRLVSHGRAPLLDVELLRRLPGYANGLGLGMLYFTGFTGLLLVLSVYLQEGLGLSPLRAGLLIAPYAAGSAISAPLAGRFVASAGRRISVVALVVVAVGVALVAVLAPSADAGTAWRVLVPCLFLAGLGGGAVVSPNLTLSLGEVPPRMGGAAGGALQTGQRIGSSIGSALLVTVYTLVSGHASDGAALRIALVVGIALFLGALVMAVVALRTERSGTAAAATA